MATVTTARTGEQVQRDVLEEMKWNARVQPNKTWEVLSPPCP